MFTFCPASKRGHSKNVTDTLDVVRLHIVRPTPKYLSVYCRLLLYLKLSVEDWLLSNIMEVDGTYLCSELKKYI